MSSTDAPPASPLAPPTPTVPPAPHNEQQAVAKVKTEPRPYVVLRKNAVSSPASPQTWEFLRNVEATSQQQACRKAAEILLAAGEEGTITLVAITAARFVPVTVTAEVKTQLKLS